MFMADLCCIFIYIIKWSTETIWIEVCLLLNKCDKKKSLLHYYRISIFLKRNILKQYDHLK